REHVDVAALDQPGDEGPHPGARHRGGVAQADEALALDHALPGLEGLAELPTLEGGLAHPAQQGQHAPAPGVAGDGHRFADEVRVVESRLTSHVRSYR